jgi:hypothetical protein
VPTGSDRARSCGCSSAYRLLSRFRIARDVYVHWPRAAHWFISGFTFCVATNRDGQRIDQRNESNATGSALDGIK